MIQSNDLLKKRVYALTTDFFIVVVTNYSLMASFTSFLKTVFFYFPLRAQLYLIQKFSMVSSISLMSLMFAYFSLFYFVTNGRTLGKTLFGLKVVNSDQSEITLIQSMQRAFAYFACAMFGSFLFALSFIRKDEKSLADVLSKTDVAFDTANELNAGSEFQLTLLHSIETAESSEEDKAA